MQEGCQGWARKLLGVSLCTGFNVLIDGPQRKSAHACRLSLTMCLQLRMQTGMQAGRHCLSVDTCACRALKAGRAALSQRMPLTLHMTNPSPEVLRCLPWHPAARHDSWLSMSALILRQLCDIMHKDLLER